MFLFCFVGAQILRTFSAHSPHILRTFSAHSPHILRTFSAHSPCCVFSSFSLFCHARTFSALSHHILCALWSILHGLVIITLSCCQIYLVIDCTKLSTMTSSLQQIKLNTSLTITMTLMHSDPLSTEQQPGGTRRSFSAIHRCLIHASNGSVDDGASSSGDQAHDSFE